LNEIQKSKERKTRYTSRIIPISSTCFGNMQDITKLASKLFKNTFEDIEPCTFCIIPKCRHNSKITRELLIQKIAPLVGGNHTVDLNNAEYTIIIQVLNHVAGISIVQNYQKLKRFNIEELLKEK
jgi:tRNA acetyltransferase TAN1